MSKMSIILVGLVAAFTLVSGAGAVIVPLIPSLAASLHARSLIAMFQDSWKSGVGALIGLLAGLGLK